MRRRLSRYEREAIAAAILRRHLGWDWRHVADVLKLPEADIRERVAAHRERQGRIETAATALRETRPA